ncbi:retropepsin-like aspartic protease [Jiangella gansuensis]|uniref:retropepsin-like aspartic protease n=1 Tax=Jiangella gansuensis TaxID=281473 RepID=UPI0004B6AF7E|nr:retropepsin-like aspartic protease [Jiangella gansuensis]
MPDHLPKPVRPSRRSVLAALGAAPLGAAALAAAAPLAAHAEPNGGAAAASADPDELFASGRFAAADAGYRRILVRQPDHAHALAQRGYIALLSNDFEDAERFLSRAIEVAPDDVASKARLADCHVRQGKAEAAVPLLLASGQQAKAAQYAAMVGHRPFEPHGEPVDRLPLLHLDPLPVLEASCNGHRARYFFDTGATVVIGAATALAAGVEALASEDLQQGGKPHRFNYGVADSFALGGLELRHVPVMWTESPTAMPPVPDADEQPTGVIGTTLISHLLATLDYGRREMVVRRPTAQQRRAFRAESARARASVMPFWMAPDHFLFAPATVEGHGPRVCSIDTGGPGIGLVVTEADAEMLGLEVDYDDEQHFFGKPVYPFTGASVRMGKIRRDVPGIAGDLNYSLARGGFRSLGNVSHEFFRPLAFTFDFVDMRLSLARTT